jgi:nitrate/TMAO reductase-like tetraheme cytochrome c subunit
MLESIPIPTRSFATLLPLALFLLLSPGCAQIGLAQNANAQSESCRSCHAPNGPAGAKDFSSIFANPKSHHPVGVIYPIGSDNQKFKLPNHQTTDIAFFDRNDNGRPDSNEIQLFGMNGEVRVECASCHKEHGDTQINDHVPGDMYLRFANTGSAMCVTCHKQ